MLGRRIVRALAEPVEDGDNVYRIGASIGIAFALLPVDVEQLIDRADTALYIAKRAGRGTVRFWAPPPETAVIRAA